MSSDRHRRRDASLGILSAAALAVTSLAGCADDDEASGGARLETASSVADPGSSTTAAPQSPSAPEPFTLRVGFVSSNEQWLGPEGYSYAHGGLKQVLAQAGAAELELSAFPNGPNLNQALQAGALDIGIYGDTPAIVARAAGVETRVLVQNSVGIDAWIVTTADGPASISELEGATVVVAQGSYMDRYLRGVLANAGLTDKVALANIVPPPDQKAALDRGDVQAIAATSTNALLLEQQGYKVIHKASADSPELRGTSVTVITRSALESHPQLVDAWRTAYTEAVEEVNAAKDDYLDFFASSLGIPLDVISAVTPVGPDGEFTLYPRQPFTDDGRALIEGTKSFLVENEFAKEDFALDDWFVPLQS